MSKYRSSEKKDPSRSSMSKQSSKKDSSKRQSVKSQSTKSKKKHKDDLETAKELLKQSSYMKASQELSNKQSIASPKPQSKSLHSMQNAVTPCLASSYRHSELRYSNRSMSKDFGDIMELY